MLLTEYDEVKAMELFREEGREEGLEEGRKEGQKEGRKEGRDLHAREVFARLLDMGMPRDQARVIAFG